MKTLLITLACTLATAIISPAQAQPWPAKPVGLLAPFPPGGSTDMIARTLGDLGFEIVGNTPEQFTAVQATEFARWKR